MKLVSYKAEQKTEWNTFLGSSKNGIFLFNRDFMDYHADRFEDASLMVYDDADKLIALLPANIRGEVLYTHQGLTFGGFVSDRSMRAATMLSIFTELRTWMKAKGIQKLVYKAVPHIYHQQPSEEDIYALFRNDAAVVRVDISTTVNLRDRIKVSDLRKRGAKKAAKAGITVQESARYAEFMTVLTETLEAQHGAKPVHSLDELRLLVSRFPDQIKLFTAERGGVVLAGTLIFEYPKLAHAQYIASSLQGKEEGALDAIFVQLLDVAYQSKEYFDFGISTEQGGRFLNDGLIHQKEGFGGRSVCHHFYEMKTSI